MESLAGNGRLGGRGGGGGSWLSSAPMGPPDTRQQALAETDLALLASPGRSLAVLFGVAFALRACAVTRTAVIFNDGPEFLRIAGDISNGAFAEALTHHYHPLYPACIALVSRLGIEPEAAAIGISVVSGSLAVLALYAFLRLAFGGSVAFVGAMMLALHPYAIRFSADVQSDALYLALFLGSVAALYAALERRCARRATLAGLLCGAGYLTRPESLGVLFAGLVLIGVAALRGRWTGAAAARVGAALGAGVTLMAMPYWIGVRFVSGQWQLSQKKSVLELLAPSTVLGDRWGLLLFGAGGFALGAAALWMWLRRGDAAGRAWAFPRIGALGLAVLFAASALAALWIAPDLMQQFAADVISALRPELALLLALGIVARAGAGPNGRAIFISTLLGLYAVVLFGLLLEYGYLSRRHTLPPLVLSFGYAALGGLWLVDTVASRTARVGRVAWLVALLVLLAIISFPKAFHDHRGEELAGRRAAEWLREADPTGGIVASNKSKLGYYAARPWQSLHWQGELRRLADLHSTGVRWLILEENALDESLQPRAPYAEVPPAVLVERHRVTLREHHAFVYEVVPKP